MKTKYPIVFLILFLSVKIFAQKAADLTGIVTDSMGTGLFSATVVLMEKKDSTLAAFGITEADGRFLVKKVTPGEYLLQVSYVGYETHWQPLEVPAGNDKMEVGKITLAPASSVLDEVEVTADRVPLRMNGDTINYNAAAFKVQPGAVVEDLLKKLPGVEVEADGTIKAQGETVQNVFVDGKEFFGNDPQVATKNLPADAVNKVQVYDKKSDMAEFTGIEDGRESKTINLELKDDHKNGYFGNATAGGGTNERYQGRFNLNRFSKNSQLSGIGMANNINQAGFSFNDYMQFKGGLGSMMGGGGGGNRSVRMSFDLGQTGIPLEGGQVDGLMTTWAGGLNFNRDFGKKTELRTSYFLSKIQNDILRSTERQNLLGDQSFRSTEDENTHSESFNHNLNLRLKHEIDSFQDLSLRSALVLSDARYNSFGSSQTFGSNGFLENENSRDYRSTGQRLDLTNTATYRCRFGKKGRAFVADGSFNLGTNSQDGKLISETNFYQTDSVRIPLNQRQNTSDDAMSYGLSASYTEPLGKAKYLEINASRQNYTNETGKDFYDIGPGGESQNDDLTNHYDRGYTYDHAGLSFMVNRKLWNLTGGSAVQRSSLEGQQRGESEALKRSFTRLLPSLFFNYEPGIGRNFRFEYQTDLREPSPEQLQPLVDNSDPLNLYVGNPNLQPEYAHELSANFMRFDQFTFTSFFANIQAEYVKDRITNASSVDSLFRGTVRPVNVKNDRSLRGFVDFSTPLRPLKTTIRLNFNTSWNRGILFVNEQENSTNRITNNIDLSFSNRKKKQFDATIGARLSHNKTTYSDAEALNQTYLNRRYYAEASVYPNKKWEFGSKFRYSVYSDVNFGSEQVVPLWETSISRYLLKNNRGKLTLSGFDLLNRNVGIRRNSELNYLEEQRTRPLGRYVMLTFAYSIQGFGKEGGITIDVRGRED